MKYLLLCILAFPTAYAVEKVNENNLEQLVNENPSVQSYEQRLQGAEQLKGRLTRSFLPKVTLSYGHEKFTTGPYYNTNQPYGGVEASLNLFNSGKDKLENEKRIKEAEIAKIDSEMMKSQVLAELKKALSHYAYLEEICKITKDAIEQNEMNLKRAQKRIEAGLATKTDILDFKQQKVQLTQELSTLEFELGVTLRLVNTLLGSDPKSRLEISFVNAHPEHSDEAKLDGAGKSLIAKKAELSQEVVNLELKQNKRWWTPSLDVYAYAQRFTQKEREYTSTGQRNDVTLGFKFTFPIFDGGEGYAGAKSSQALARAQEGVVRSKSLEVERNTQDALRRLELAHNLIHGSEENAKIMSEYRSEILTEYSKGVKNSPDVLQASQRWISAQTRYAEVKKNYQFAKVDAAYLASLQGK